MSIEFQCNQCQSILRVAAEHAGKQAKCPQCEFINIIPMSSTTPAAPERNTASSDNPYQSTTAAAPAKYVEAHRGGLILALGIISIVGCNCCFVPGILAWVFGATDLGKMKAGRMDPSGETLTRVGMILGIIGTAVAALGSLLGFLMSALPANF
ncbi:MAG: DUF4190 domain-containing protein [Planctomycetota bacterium]|nr:DUF4190 domain-containing protein [Planctomycetota bacterium]